MSHKFGSKLSSNLSRNKTWSVTELTVYTLKPSTQKNRSTWCSYQTLNSPGDPIKRTLCKGTTDLPNSILPANATGGFQTLLLRLPRWTFNGSSKSHTLTTFHNVIWAERGQNRPDEIFNS